MGVALLYRICDNALVDSLNASQLVADLQALGLTQKEIAERSGCGQSTVSALLQGTRGKRIGYALITSLRDVHRQETAKQKRRRKAA